VFTKSVLGLKIYFDWGNGAVDSKRVFIFSVDYYLASLPLWNCYM